MFEEIPYGTMLLGLAFEHNSVMPETCIVMYQNIAKFALNNHV